MLGGVTRPMLPHLTGVPHLHVNRLVVAQVFYHCVSECGVYRSKMFSFCVLLHAHVSVHKYSL